MNIFAANLSSSKITHVHILVITNLLLFFQINFNMKMPKFLTVLCQQIVQIISQKTNSSFFFLKYTFIYILLKFLN